VEHCRKLEFERLVFAMVLNRLVDPQSKLACNDWIQDQAYFPEGEGWKVDQFYAALDVMEAHAAEISDRVARGQLARLEPEQRRHLLLDTTAAFTESEMDDEQRAEIASWWDAHDAGQLPAPVDPRPQVVNDPPLRMRGHSKDHRPDAPQVVVGLATARGGEPVWHEVFAGNTSDKVVTRKLVSEVLSRHPEQEVVVVGDSGMAGSKNLAWLAEHPGKPGWLFGTPVRKERAVEALLRRPGRWKQLERSAPEGPWTLRACALAPDERVDPNREERLILVRSPSRARRDWRKLEKELATVKAELAKDPSPPPKGSRVRRLSSPNRSRLLSWNEEKGRLEVDEEAVASERRRAGVRAMRTTMVDVPPGEVLAAYDQLLGVEADFRTFKSPLRLRPMYHRSAHRIRAHVAMCFLAVLCQREIERRVGRPWAQTRKVLASVHATQMAHGSGTWWQRSELPEDVHEVLRTFGIEEVEQRWVTSTMPTTKRVRR
jgi:hypothetical protein